MRLIRHFLRDIIFYILKKQLDGVKDKTLDVLVVVLRAEHSNKRWWWDRLPFSVIHNSKRSNIIHTPFPLFLMVSDISLISQNHGLLYIKCYKADHIRNNHVYNDTNALLSNSNIQVLFDTMNRTMNMRTVFGNLWVKNWNEKISKVSFQNKKAISWK